MPMHDWTKVHAAIFHAFHHGWISAISAALNRGTLPTDYYALLEQVAARPSPNLLQLQGPPADDFHTDMDDAEFYRRKKSSIVVRQVRDDRMVAMIEIVSPGNKSNRPAFQAFVDLAHKLLEHRIHLLIVDPFPPGPHDPHGVHAAIWRQFSDDTIADQAFGLICYECDVETTAYVDSVILDRALPDMPLFLESKRYVNVPLEATYETAFSGMPRKWKKVLASPKSG